MSNNVSNELFELLELLIEGEISTQQTQRLEQIVSADPQALATYIEYIDLHGSLHWDTARSGQTRLPPGLNSVDNSNNSRQPVGNNSKRRLISSGLLIACVIPLLIAGLLAWQPWNPGSNSEPTLVDVPPGEDRVLPNQPGDRDTAPVGIPVIANNNAAQADSTVPDRDPPQPDGPAPVEVSAVVARIDELVQQAWAESEIRPSEIADDSEWVRRVHLDLVGRIPDVDEVRSFLTDKDPGKREKLVDRLLDDVGFVRHQATTWTNLLVGRAEERRVNQSAVEKFLRDGFATNRGWDQLVTELITAKGSVEDNAASGFLLAHLNNQAVPATAITARLLLGMQVQCTQCHDHPDNSEKQEQFWAFNSIFKQIERHESVTQTSDGQRLTSVSIVTRPQEGPTFYETRRGLMKAAYPAYDGIRISPDAGTDRRAELARLLTTGNETRIARAFVNRVWSHLFGYGFTNPVDDMGSHVPVSHPQLLSELSRSFVSSGYDLKQLFRWICLSDAYQRTSRFADANSLDNPDDGSPPLFSRMYTRSMTAEQVYDSLLVATQAHMSPGFDWARSNEKRHEWIQQFVHAHATDENDESSTFDGTITQAMMMMNGQLVDDALNGDRGTLLRTVLTGRGSDTDRIKTLSLAALSREPTPEEIDRFRQMLRRLAGPNRQQRVAVFLQDLFWAYLNSGEFAVVH